jgi:hypothetical protein
VDQAVLVHADVDEGAECGDVGDDPLEHHTGGEVLHLAHVVAETRRLEHGARVAAWLGQLGHDVGQGRLAHAVADVAADVDAIGQRGVADQRAQLDAEIAGDALDQRVALRVHGRSIERMRRVRDAQEAGALLERARPDARHGQQIGSRAERSLHLAVRDDAARHLGRDAGHVRQQRRAGGVERDADLVDARLDHLGQHAAEHRLEHVVLVLTHADRLGLDLDQLGQRILQATRDRDGAADGQVEIRKLLTRGVRRAVHAGPGLAHLHHDEIGDAGVAQHLAHERLGLAAAGAVADRDRRRHVPAHELQQLAPRLLAPGVSVAGIDGHVAQEATGHVDRGAFAAGAQARIDADDRLLPQRRGQQQISQVLGEHADRRAVRPLLELGAHLVLDAGREQALETVARGQVELAGERRLRAQPDQLRDAGQHLLAVDVDVRAQVLLVLAAPDGQEAVRRDVAHRLAEVVVLLELARLGGAGRHHLHDQVALIAEGGAHRGAHVGVLGHRLGHDVARAGQGLVGPRHALVDVDEPVRLGQRIAALRLGQDAIGQRPQPALARDGGARPPLGLVRQVQVLELRFAVGGQDARA